MTEIIRDKRTQAFYITPHVIIDEYFPVIHQQGFAIYSLLSSLANRNRRAEVAFPGLRLMKEFLGLGATTITQYTALLEWLNLIEVERGNRQRSNTYTIVDVKPLTPDILKQLQIQLQAQHAHIALSASFIKKITKAIGMYKPLTGHFQTRKQAVTSTAAAQKLPIFNPKGDPTQDQGDPTQDQGDPTQDQGDPTQDQGDPVWDRNQEQITRTNNQKQIITTSPSTKHHMVRARKNGGGDGNIHFTQAQILLKQAGIDPGRKLTELADTSTTDALAMIWFTAVKSDKLRNPVGYLISQLSRGYLPPNDYLDFADFYVESNGDESWLFEDLPIGLSESAAQCGSVIYNKIGTFDVPNLKTPIKVNQSAQHVPSDLADIIMR